MDIIETFVEVMPQDERDYLRGLLNEEKIRIKFTKVDGSESELIGTTCPYFLPVVEDDGADAYAEKEPKKVKKVNPDVLTMFNVDKQAWRSVKYDLIQNYEIVQQENV